MDLSEAELNQRLESCSQEDPQYAALLCDLANVKLQKGEQEAAQELLQQAYALRSEDINALVPAGDSQTAADGVAGDGAADGSDDDWENADWESAVTDLKSASSLNRDATATASSSGTGGGSKHTAAGFRGGSGTSAAVPRPRGRGQAEYGTGGDSDEEGGGDAAAARRLPHVVEFYALSKTIKTLDLEDCLADFHWGGVQPSLHWLDDEHALASFPCKEAADALLEAAGRLRYKVRPYSQASAKAHEMLPEELAPPRGARPKTTAAVARRLISAALGNSNVRDRAGERELAELRKEARQERRNRQQQLEEAWGAD